MAKAKSTYERRRNRVRNQLKKVAGGRPRLSVFRSGKHIYAQIIDDREGKTIASASSIETDLRKSIANGGNVEGAVEVGKAIAERATKAGVKDVIFDRGGYIYHGRVKALADAAREAGLNF